MNEQKMIGLLNKTRHQPYHYKGIKREILNLFSDVKCPDLTDVWNLAEELSRKEQITIYDMNNIWKALNEMVKDGECILADFE